MVINVKLKSVKSLGILMFPQMHLPATDKRAFFFYYLEGSSAKYCNVYTKKGNQKVSPMYSLGGMFNTYPVCTVSTVTENTKTW